MKKYNKVILACLLLMLIAACSSKKEVLIIGDSISLGYTPFVKKNIDTTRYHVVHNKGNAMFAANGVKNIDKWLGDTKWDIIHFNFGLWDLCYRNPESKMQGHRDKVNGKLTASLDEYRANLEKIATRLDKTGARIIFATTTVVPPKEAGRIEGDEVNYNKVAVEVMKEHNFEIDDLHSISIDIHKKYPLGVGNVHYKKAGYELLSKQVIKCIEGKTISHE